MVGQESALGREDAQKSFGVPALGRLPRLVEERLALILLSSVVLKSFFSSWCLLGVPDIN